MANEQLKPSGRPISIEALDEAFSLRRSRSFESIYRHSFLLDLKFRWAEALLAQGKLKKPDFLVRDFIPPDSVIRSLTPDQQATAKSQIERRGLGLRDKLHLIMAEKGYFKEGSEEEKQAQEAVIRNIESDEILSQLMGILPIHVMGAVVNARLFDQVSDAAKREKLRGWTTRALLRPYLGDIAVHLPKGKIDFRQFSDLIPARIFEDRDSATLNIIKNHMVGLALSLFMEGEDQGFAKLRELVDAENSPVRREFMEDLYHEFETIRDVEIPQVFVDHLEGWFADTSPFPLFRQKYFVYKFINAGNAFLNGDTGATKTACSYMVGETFGVGAEQKRQQKKPFRQIVIFGPAKARDTWPAEAKKIFRSDKLPSVFPIEESPQLHTLMAQKAKYLYIGSELLGRAWKDASLFKDIGDLVIEKRATDAVFLDEADEFRNEKTGMAKVLMELMARLRAKNPEISTLALTATPITKSLEDLDIALALQHPERFALPGAESKEKHTFSNTALKDPKIAFSLLFGEQFMIQWSLEDIFGDKAIPPEPQFVYPTLTPSEIVLYQFVEDLKSEDMSSLSKIGMLRSVLLDPQMIIKTIKKHNLVPDRVYESEVDRLYELFDLWQKWRTEKDPSVPDMPFSADWIAQFGDRDFLLQLFFDDRYANGVESLVNSTPQLWDQWVAKESASSKYEYLRDFLQEHMVRNDDGQYEEKVFIISPYHKKGITRWMDDPNISDEDLAENSLSLYEYVRGIWLPGNPDGFAVNIDGTQSFDSRRNHAETWRNSGTKSMVMVASMKSIYESMDWAVRDTEDNKNIKTVNVIYLGWPWGWDEFKQMSGRFNRPGSAKKVNMFVYESQNTIDQGLRDLVQMKFLLTQMALAGIQLTPEEQAFFTSTQVSKRILTSERKFGQLYLQDSFRRLQGTGEDNIEKQFASQKDGKIVGQEMARLYFDIGNDEYRIPGNNAELVKTVLLKPQPQAILSVGAGTCLLARKVAQSNPFVRVDNVDINEAVLRLTKEQFPTLGDMFVGRASQLSAADESYDAVDCSFMLDLTQLYKDKKIAQDVTSIERVKVIAELNRVLRSDGTLVIALPDSALDNRQYTDFATALTEHFGFEIQEPSGLSFATDLGLNRRLGWILTLKKKSTVNLQGLNPEKLTFTTDNNVRINTYGGKKKNGKGTVVLKPDYPFYSPHNFKVFNPLTGQETTTSSEIGEEQLTLEEAYLYKYNLSDGDKVVWDHTRRTLEDRLSIRYEDAELVTAQILLKLRFTNLQLESTRRLTQREVNRYIRDKGGES